MIQKHLTSLAKCLMVAIVLSSSGASFAQAGLSQTERPLPEFEHDPVVGHRSSGQDALCGLLGRTRLRRLIVGRQRIALAGGQTRDASGQVGLGGRRNDRPNRS